MNEEHVHTPPTFSANNKIVCEDCVTPEEEQGNECFCRCHQVGQFLCPKCKTYHKSI